METTKRFGDVVARLRREKGLTQEQLAACVGVSAPAVSKWETGVHLDKDTTPFPR